MAMRVVSRVVLALFCLSALALVAHARPGTHELVEADVIGEAAAKERAHALRFRTVAALRKRLSQTRHVRAEQQRHRQGVGASAFTAVTLDGAAAVISAGTINHRLHITGAAAGAGTCDIAFTFTNPLATTLAWRVHGGGGFATVYDPANHVGALNMAGAFVWQHNLANGANDFDVRLTHSVDNANTDLRLHIYREQYGRDLTAGLELESHLNLRLVRPDSVANHANMANLHPTRTAANVPHIGVPYLQFDIDGLGSGGGRSWGILELVTGPLATGQAQGAVTQDWRDLMYAMAQWWASTNAVLGNCNGGNSITGVDDNGPDRWRLLNDIVTHYNNALNAVVAGRAGLGSFVLNAVAAHVLVSVGLAPNSQGHVHRWYAKCGFVYAQAQTNLQVNIDYPLNRFGLVKGGNIDNANPTHFIDLFPAHNHATYANWNSQTLMLRRAQAVAGALVDGLNLYPAHDNVLISELKGAFTAVLNEVMIRTHQSCKHNVDTHNGVVANIGWSKNLRVNMVKACAQDLFRGFPAAVSAAVMAWWNNGAVSNGIVTQLMAAAGATGAFMPLQCTQAPNAGGDNGVTTVQNLARQYMADYGRQSFHPYGLWSARYGVSETNLVIGDHGVVTDVAGGGVVANHWDCVSGGGFTSHINPLTNKLWERRAVVIESRFKGMQLNVALLNTHTPLVNDGNANLVAGLDLFRGAAGAPNAQ